MAEIKIEEDFSKLSVEERCQHKAWNARLSGYKTALELFETEDKSEEFSKYLGLLKKFVVDSNAVAQEHGLVAVLAFLKNSTCAPKTVNDVMNGLISKCFASPRAKTRELAVEITLMYVEIEKQDVVLEELNKGLENKSPKVVSTSIIALRKALQAFGSKVISIKPPIIKVLLKLLESRDKGVREESKQLCVEIYRWIGDAVKTLLQSLKPITLAELENEFQKVAGKAPAPIRYLKSEQERLAKYKENGEQIKSGDCVNSEAPEKVDSYSLMIAVDILSKLPKNFYEKCEAKQWQERKEALEVLLQLTTNVKLEAGDYGDLVKILKKLIGKDSNILVVSLATKCLTNLVLGLRKHFQPYAQACIPTVFAKFKEKKQNVVVALRETIDTFYSISSLDTMSEDIKSALDNKNPQVKAETCAFLTRCFRKCSPTQLNKKLLKIFTAYLLKTLNDTDSVVRENSVEALGTALKVSGESAILPFLKEIDAIKIAKIKSFCDNKTVPSKPEIEIKKTSPVKSISINKAVTKPISGEIKKSASTKTAKSKPCPTVSMTATPPSCADKKTQINISEPEFQEHELSEEDILERLSEFISVDLIEGLNSSNWKDRLESAEKISETVHQCKKNSIPAQSFIKLLARKPGFKDNNFQVLKLRLEILTFIAYNSQISHIAVNSCLSDVVDKIGDIKTGVYAGLALTALAEATGLEYISLEVLNIAFSQRNPKKQSEALIWVANGIKQFGLKIQMKEVIEHAKKALSSNNAIVRTAALSLVGIIYMYVGKPLRSFFEKEKASLLQRIDAEFDKMNDTKPPTPVKGKSAKNDGSGNSFEKIKFDETDRSEDSFEKKSAETDRSGASFGKVKFSERDRSLDSSGNTKSDISVNLADLPPRVDISHQITTKLLSDLSDKDWNLRSEALQIIATMIIEAEFVTPNLGDLPNALKPRMMDINKKIVVQALKTCQILGTSLGVHTSKQIRNFAPAMLICLGDSKAHVRTAALQCLNSWLDQCPLASLFEGQVMFDVLTTENSLLRIELFGWLTEKLPTVTSLPIADLNLCIPILMNCLEDRNTEVKKKACDCLLPFMIHVGYESMHRVASKLKPSSKTTVIAQLDKVRQILPGNLNTKSKHSPLQIESDINKTKTKRNITKSKLTLKPSVTMLREKKVDDTDTSPSLALNNMKEQRLIDERSCKVLKWNFISPREEFYLQLKEQMISANWNRTLISHCYHNEFKFHIKAIDLLVESLKNNVETSAANLDLILKWFALRFFDTNPSVLIKILEYLQVLFPALLGINYHLLEPEAAAFIPYLILKIGEPKDAIRKGVREIIKAITKVYPYSKIFSYIMQGLGSKNARQRIECLEELESMIEIYGLSVCQPSPTVALKEMARHISDRDNCVRNAALNCIVQGYLFAGEKIYTYVGQLTDKNLNLLEERIKRSTKLKTNKSADTSISPSIPKVDPTTHINKNKIFETAAKMSKSVSSVIPGPLKLNIDDIQQIFKYEKPSLLVPGLVNVNTDEILNLSDIQLPLSRSRPPASSLKLNDSNEIKTAINLIMAQLTAQDIPAVKEGFDRMNNLLSKNYQAIKIFSSRVDHFLVMAIFQYRYAYNKHMEDGNISKADIISVYRSVTLSLVTLFDNPDLAKKASTDVIKDLIKNLIFIMLDHRLEDLKENTFVIKAINVLTMRILQKSNATHTLSALIKLLHDIVGGVITSDSFTDLIMKCVWKMIRIIPKVINELNIDVILLDTHVFFKSFPSSTWKEKYDIPIRTVKTIIFHLVRIKKGDILKHLSLVTDHKESELVAYIEKLISHKLIKTSDSNLKQDKSSPSKNSKSTHDSLTEIFKKIGCKDQTKEGIDELYEFKQKHPEVDIEPYIKSSEFLQNYIRQCIQEIENERGSIKYTQDSHIRSGQGDTTEGSNLNLSSNCASFTNCNSQDCSAFPPLPPFSIDTTPMDLVAWLKKFVTHLDMDTSKYDDPTFLDKFTGSRNKGPMSNDEILRITHDLRKYKNTINDFKKSM